MNRINYFFKVEPNSPEWKPLEGNYFDLTAAKGAATKQAPVIVDGNLFRVDSAVYLGFLPANSDKVLAVSKKLPTLSTCKPYKWFDYIPNILQLSASVSPYCAIADYSILKPSTAQLSLGLILKISQLAIARLTRGQRIKAFTLFATYSKTAAINYINNL